MCIFRSDWLLQVTGSNRNFFFRSKADLASKGQIWPQNPHCEQIWPLLVSRSFENLNFGTIWSCWTFFLLNWVHIFLVAVSISLRSICMLAVLPFCIFKSSFCPSFHHRLASSIPYTQISSRAPISASRPRSSSSCRPHLIHSLALYLSPLSSNLPPSSRILKPVTSPAFVRLPSIEVLLLPCNWKKR